MKRIIKVLVIFMLSVFFIYPNSSFAEEFLDAGDSNPSMIYVYGKLNFSQLGYWDLTEVENIPDTAIVKTAAVRWSICTSCGMNYMDTHVALMTEDGYGDYMDSGFHNPKFSGEPVKQVWSVKYYVTNNLIGGRGYITPKLLLYWVDQNSSKSGTVALMEKHPNGNLIQMEDVPYEY